jgi:hypothetical protein
MSVKLKNLYAQAVVFGVIVSGRKSMHHNYDVDKLRVIFVDTFKKMKLSLALTDLEKQIAYVIGLYPQYHQYLSDYQQTGRMYESDDSNPFLTLSLHVAILEQVSTNRPEGILDLYHLATGYIAAIEVEKLMAGVLYDQMHEALLQGHPPDESEYLQKLKNALLQEKS